jgi:hypothetical protein
MQRFFRTADAVLYDAVRLHLDAAWGHPNSQTVTCIVPASDAPQDDYGRILLAVRDEFASWEPAATLLPQLLSSGQAEEITAYEYQAALASNPD